MKDRARIKNPVRTYSAPAVDRTLDILEFMALHPRPYGATELSRRLNIPMNSVFRILKRLTDRQYTAQDPLSDGYQLSTKVFSLGMSLYTRFELRQRARPHLEWLSRETEETCQLQIPRGDMVLVLDTVSPEVSYYIRVVPGGLVCYHPNAFGKVMLAFLSEEEIKKIIPPRLPSLTPHTIVIRTELMKELEEVRRTGLGYDNEEYNEGIRCIGSPVFDVEGKVVAGLGVSGLVSTFRNNRQATFEQLVMECAYRVSRDIGYSGDYFADKRVDVRGGFGIDVRGGFGIDVRGGFSRTPPPAEAALSHPITEQLRVPPHPADAGAAASGIAVPGAD